MKERFRDKSRGELLYASNGLGVSAEMAERGQVEEKAENSWYQRSLGVIDISEEPITVDTYPEERQEQKKSASMVGRTGYPR